MSRTAVDYHLLRGLLADQVSDGLTRVLVDRAAESL